MAQGLSGTESNKSKESMKAVSPEGNNIIGTLDVVRGTARAEIQLNEKGALNIEYLGETEVDWDSQETKTLDGERLFVCSQRKVWKENEVVRATQSNRGG
jgi:hypothetical protein